MNAGRPSRPLQVQLEALDRGHEAAQRHDARGSGPALAERRRRRTSPSPARSRRAPAGRGSRPCSPRKRVEPAGEPLVGGQEGVRDRGSRSRAPRTSGRRPAAGSAGRGRWRPAAVAAGPSRRAAGTGRSRRRRARAAARARPRARRRRAAGGGSGRRRRRHRAAARGLSSGVSVSSICSRIGSKRGGSTRLSPRCSGVLVGGEARAHRRDLEQHAAGLAEVDRLEPEAVDHRGGMRAALAARARARPRGRPSATRTPRGARCRRRAARARRAGRRRRRARRAARRAPPSRRRSARSRACRAAPRWPRGRSA